MKKMAGSDGGTKEILIFRERERPYFVKSLRGQLLFRFAMILLLMVFLIGLMQALSLRRAMLLQLQDLLESRLHNVPVGLLASSDTAKDVALRADDLMKALVDQDVTLLILDAGGEEIAHSETVVRDWYNSRLIPMERKKEPLAVPRLGSGAYLEMLQADGFPDSIIYRMPDGTRMVLGFSKLGNLQSPAGMIQMAVSAGEADEFVLRQLGAFGILAIAALCLGGFLASRVLHRTLNPLRRLNDAVEAQNADSLEQRISEDAGQEEIDRLSHAYNLMLSRIQEAFSHERLQRDRMRRFLSDVAHELRTPLTSIHGFAEVLLMGAAEDEAQLSDSLEVIRSESDRLGTLVQSLLDLANLEQGAAFSREPGDLTALLTAMKPQLLLLAGSRRLEFDLPEQARNLYQEDRIRQVILNLFQNAVAHTYPDMGVIRIAIREEKQEGVSGHLLSVGDNGCGIPSEMLERVFDRFWRADAHRSRKTGGNGLGLSIVRTIAEMHSGTVHVESEIGKGTTFSLWLPKE